MAHDVFISHSTRNKSVADAVCAALEHAGIRCWVAPRDVLPGRSFAGEITRAINQSKAMVLIFSADSNNSEQILREVQLAANAHLHIIQFRIEDVTPNDDLQYYLSTPHWLDAMTAPLESHLERLETSLKVLLAPHGERAATGINESLSTDGSIIAESSGTAEKDDQGGSIEAQSVPGTLSESAAQLPSPVAPLTIEGKEKVTDQAAGPVQTNTSPTIFAATAADKKPIPAGNKETGIGRRVLIGGAAASVLALVLWAYLKSRNDAGNRQPAAPAIAAEVSPPGLAPSVQSKPSTIRQQSGMNPGISFVNMNTVFKNYSRTKEAEKEINDARDMAKQEYDERAGTYKKGLEDYSQLNKAVEGGNLSADAIKHKSRERDDKVAMLKKMEQEINEFRTTRESQLQDRAHKLRMGLVGEIMAAVRELAGPGDQALFDNSGMSANGVPVILFSPAKADMSDRVLAKLNQDRREPFSLSHALRCATVDMNLVFKSYSKTKIAETRINEARAAAKKEYDDRAETYKKALDEINLLNKELGNNSLGAQSRTQKTHDRDGKITAIKVMEREINEFRTGREKQLQEQALKMRTDIVDEITKVLAAQLPSRDVAVIIDKSGLSADGTPILIYSAPIADLSQQVIKTLNRSGPSGEEASFANSDQTRFACVDMERVLKTLPDSNKNSVAGKESEARDAAARNRSALIEKSKKYLSSYAEQNGIGLIFNVSGNSLNGVPVLVLARELPDLTDEVIAQTR